MSEKTVLITGASTGIGAACAVDLAQRGWRVFAGVRSDEAGRDLCRQCDRIVPARLDVTSAESIGSVAAMLSDELTEGLAALVNNAGIAVNGPLELIPPEELRRQFDVNFFGLVAVTRAMLPLLRPAHGRIVNMSSVSGLVTMPFLAPYAASKHAVEAISDALRIELAPWGVRVSLIEPGPVATRIWDKARLAVDAQMTGWPDDAKRLYSGYVALCREAPEDSARHAAPVEVVTAAVRRALSAGRPKARYAVGPGAIVARMRRFIPDRLWDVMVLQRLGSLTVPAGRRG